MLKLELELSYFLVFLGLKATRGEIFDTKASPVAFTKLLYIDGGSPTQI